MADEEEGPSVYLSFANRYQADLELIYQKYDKTFEDGTIESQEILLSNLEEYDGNDGKNVDWFESLVNDDDDAPDDGWESDTSGPTDCPSQDELNDMNSLDIPSIDKISHLNSAICLKPEKRDPKQPDYPLSSTVLGDVDSILNDKVDPNISPVAHLRSDISSNIGLKGRLRSSGSLSDDTAFKMPVITKCNEFTSKNVENAKVTISSNKKKDKAEHDAKKNSGVISVASNKNNTLKTQESSVVSTSLAKAILNTRNRIANVLFEAVLSCQSENPSKSSGYDSMSSDSSCALQRMTKESLFLPDKLLKEFNSRLTAEIMSHGNDSFSTRSNAIVTRCRSNKPSVTIRPGLFGHGRKKTVSLLASRKIISVKPSLKLTRTPHTVNVGIPSQSNCPRMISGSPRAQTLRLSQTDSSSELTRSDSVLLNTSSRRKSISLSCHESKLQQIVPHNAETLQSLDSKRLRQVVSTKAILKLSPGLPAMGKMEMSVSDASGIKTQCFESTLLPRSPDGRLVTKPSLANKFFQLPQFPLPTNNRRSVPLTSRYLPATESNNDFELLSGNGTRLSRKRSSISDIESVSPKRACHRSHETTWEKDGFTPSRSNSKENSRSARVSPGLKRNCLETDKCLPNKRHKVSECAYSDEELYYSPVRSKCASKGTSKRSSVKLDSKQHPMHLNEERRSADRRNDKQSKHDRIICDYATEKYSTNTEHPKDNGRSKSKVHQHCMCKNHDDDDDDDGETSDHSKYEKIQFQGKRRESGKGTKDRNERNEQKKVRSPQGKLIFPKECDEAVEFKPSAKVQHLGDFERLHRKITRAKEHKQPGVSSRGNTDHRMSSPKSVEPCRTMPVRDSRKYRKDKCQIKESKERGCKDWKNNPGRNTNDSVKSPVSDWTRQRRGYSAKEKAFGHKSNCNTRNSPFQDKHLSKQGNETYLTRNEFICDNELQPNRNSGCSHAEHSSRNHHRVLESTRKDHAESVTQSDRCRVTQCKECTNMKNSNRIRLKERRVDARHTGHARKVNALGCSPGNCKKSLCFECGNFSLEEHSDLSISAISETAQM